MSTGLENRLRSLRTLFCASCVGGCAPSPSTAVTTWVNFNLSNLLKPHIPSKYVVSDTFTFAREINGLSMVGNFMVSFDVERLFTSILLDECIDLAVQYIIEGNLGIKVSASDWKRLSFLRPLKPI